MAPVSKLAELLDPLTLHREAQGKQGTSSQGLYSDAQGSWSQTQVPVPSSLFLDEAMTKDVTDGVLPMALLSCTLQSEIRAHTLTKTERKPELGPGQFKGIGSTSF